MKFEELNNYIKEQHEKYEAQVKEYNKKLEEYNKQNEKYLKAKDRVEKPYNQKIYSITDTIKSESEIAQEKAKTLLVNGLIELYKQDRKYDDGPYWTEYKYWYCLFSNFLEKETDLVNAYPEYNEVYEVDKKTHRINTQGLDYSTIKKMSEAFFINNIDFFIELKNFDKSFIDYKILEQIKSLLIAQGYNKGIQDHQDIQELRLQKDFLNQKLEELEKKLEKRFVLGKRKIRNEIGEIILKKAKIENNIAYIECATFIRGYEQGKTQEPNFESKDLNTLFKLMQESIEVFISKSESVKQKEEEISVLKENKDRALTDLPIKEPKEPLPPPTITPAYIYRSEWAKDEELVKEIKTLKEETLDKDVIEICDKIIAENRRLKEENRRLNIKEQEEKFRKL